MSALKFVHDLFVTSKMLEKFHDALLTNDDIPFFNEDKVTFSKVTFFANEIGIFSVDLATWLRSYKSNTQKISYSES